MNALEAHGLGRRFGRTWALRDCTFAVPRGSVTALVGANGAGKSTLLALASGLLSPTTGTVQAANAAYVAQDKPVYGAFTVAEMLRFGSAFNPGFDLAHAQRIVDGIPLDAKVRTLSGGHRTRVALAVALGRRPELVLLDEPFADLDPLAREEVLRMLMAEVADHGTTVVISSHALAELGNVCDRLLLLRSGEVRLSGGIEELIADHRVVVGDGPVRLVRASEAPEGAPPNLEELVLSYLRTEVPA